MDWYVVIRTENDKLYANPSIVIILIAAEIAVAMANIFVDLYAGVD